MISPESIILAAATRTGIAAFADHTSIILQVEDEHGEEWNIMMEPTSALVVAAALTEAYCKLNGLSINHDGETIDFGFLPSGG